jgi:cell division septum initiation protein DivIVA
MTDIFEKLAEKLPTEQKLAFLRVLNQHGISVESDTVLSKFFLTLQIYVSMYEKIPEGIHNATIWFQTAIQKVTTDFQKPVTDIAQLKTEIEKLTRYADQSAKNAEASRTRISQELARVDESLENINSSVKAGAEKASATVSNRMTELLSDALEKAMPLSDLKEAGEIFSDAIRESEQASEELRENVKVAWKMRFRALAVCFALTFLFGVLGSGMGFYFWSQKRIDDMQTYYIREISGNNQIVSELAESKRKLILQKDEDGSKFLVMENATGLTSNKRGVIKFK